MAFRLIRVVLLLFGIILFLGMEWISLSRSAGLLLQRKAIFLSSGSDEFRKTLDRSLQYDPDNGPTHLYLAAFYISRKDYPAAREETQRGFNTFASLQAYNQLGSIELSSGNLEKAEEVFNRVLLLWPEEKKSRLRLVALSITNRDYAAGAGEIERFLLSNPKDPNGHYYHGIILAEKGEGGKALQSFKKAGELTPEGDSKPLFTKDDLYYRTALVEISLGNPGAAETQLKKALELGSAVPYIKKLSQVYMLQKEFTKAKFILIQGLKKHPNDKDLLKALEELKQISQIKKGKVNR